MRAAGSGVGEHTVQRLVSAAAGLMAETGVFTSPVTWPYPNRNVVPKAELKMCVSVKANVCRCVNTEGITVSRESGFVWGAFAYENGAPMLSLSEVLWLPRT